MDRKELFGSYKGDCKIFFETGTHHGDSVQTALDLGFDKVISVEIVDSFYEECVERFKDVLGTKVFLFKGNSIELMDSMLDLVDAKCMFWIDAHDTEGELPAYIELTKIKEHNITDSIIIVDDIPVYFYNFNILSLMLSSINSNYEIKLVDALNENNGDIYPNYRAVAFLE